MAKDIFKSPIRNVPSTSSRLPPVSPFVDYTPRRTAATFSCDNNLDSTPNSITYARERRSQYYHQLAVDSNDTFSEGHYMDSPVVRRHFGFSEHLSSPPISFNDRIQQAIDLETLSRYNLFCLHILACLTLNCKEKQNGASPISMWVSTWVWVNLELYLKQWKFEQIKQLHLKS